MSYFLWELGKIILTCLNFQQNPENCFDKFSRTAFFYIKKKVKVNCKARLSSIIANYLTDSSDVHQQKYT